jgi:hypothetical protein
VKVEIIEIEREGPELQKRGLLALAIVGLPALGIEIAGIGIRRHKSGRLVAMLPSCKDAESDWLTAVYFDDRSVAHAIQEAVVAAYQAGH